MAKDTNPSPKCRWKIKTPDNGEMGTELVHLLHLLRDRYTGTFTTISKDMDVNEDALEAMMKVVGVPDERYEDGIPGEIDAD